MRQLLRWLLAILAIGLVATCVAGQEEDTAQAAAANSPETFGRWWRPPSAPVMSYGISGFWALIQGSVNAPDPLAYVTFVTQGNAVAAAGVETSNDTALVGTGYFISRSTISKRGGRGFGNWGGWSNRYPTYKLYLATTLPNFAGWWTLVVVSRDTILLYPGENPNIPNPPTPSPGQAVLQRIV
eukprot:gene3433-3705_t